MSQQNQLSNWKNQTYMIGGLIGSVFGLIAAYLYARAAEEDAVRSGGKPSSRVSTGEVIGLGLAALAMIRQITEMGKSSDKR
ncbi:MAG: hypothetical protein K8L97_06315 [Anaerolineae bacterium]|nr:hypothetical protein [Anaerolineae bacterium]